MCCPREHRRCKECGEPLTDRDRRAECCGPACRKIYNNRRMTRGAELYDLFMNMRYDRGAAKLFGLWKIMCRMAQAWREEDKRDRSGRPSFEPAGVCRDRSTIYLATRVH